MSDAQLLRAIASGGYSPEMDHDGSTARRLLSLAKRLESDAPARELVSLYQWRDWE